MRNPFARAFDRLPHRWRVAADWVLTVGAAILVVVAIKLWIVNPYRIPSPSMEPTLHCEKTPVPKTPTIAPGRVEPQDPLNRAHPPDELVGRKPRKATPLSIQCQGDASDRVLTNRFIYHLRDPRRGEIIVFDTPKQAKKLCGVGGDYVKRLIGLPGDVVTQRRGITFINGKRLDEPYVPKAGRDERTGRWLVPEGQYFFMGDNRRESCDSRTWGSVPRSMLIGKVFATYWPLDRLGLH